MPTHHTEAPAFKPEVFLLLVIRLILIRFQCYFNVLYFCIIFIVVSGFCFVSKLG